MSGGRSRKRTKWRRVGGWWERTRLNEFEPLLSFANAEITDDNFQTLLWQAMGSERLYRITVNGEERLCRPDDLAYVAMETLRESPARTTSGGRLSWAPGRGFIPEADVIRAMEQLPAVPVVPKLFGEPATAHEARELQAKIRTILTRLARSTAVRDGAEDIRSPVRDELEIRDAIRNEFRFPDWRSARIHADAGFIEFDDHGEDAARIAAWMLAGLTDVAFREERGSIRRCRFCEGYFIHSTLRQKDFCKPECRIRFHNKGLGRP